MRTRSVPLLLLVLSVALGSSTAHALTGDCGQPFSIGDTPTATDALFALRAAVGLLYCDPASCDLDGNCAITATDSLGILKTAVGQPTNAACRDTCGFDLEIDELSLGVDWSSSDGATIEGRISPVSLDGVEVIRILLAGNEFELETAKLMGDGDLLTYATMPGWTGISQFSIDLSEFTFSVTIDDWIFERIPNPVAVGIEIGRTADCVIVYLDAEFVAPIVGGATAQAFAMLPVPEGGLAKCLVDSPTLDPPAIVVPVVDPALRTRGANGELDPVLINVHLETTTVEPPDGGTLTASIEDNDLGLGPSFCMMADDGAVASGDAVAGDGVFSCDGQLDISELASRGLDFRPPSIGITVEGDFSGSTVTAQGTRVYFANETTADIRQSILDRIALVEAIWEDARATHATIELAATAAGEAFRGLEGVVSVGVRQNRALRVRFSDGLLITPKTGGDWRCAVDGSAGCVTRCGEPAVPIPGSTTLRRPSSQTPLPRRPTAASAGERIPAGTVIRRPHIVLWDQDYFTETTRTYEDSEYLIDKSVLGQSYPRDRDIVDRIVADSVCPKFTATKLIAPNATIADLRQHAASAGILSIVTHGVFEIPSSNVSGFRAAKVFGFVVKQSVAAIAEGDAALIQSGRVIALDAAQSLLAGSFFSNLPDLDGAIFWGGACSSASSKVTPRMATIALRAGASAYYGFTQVVNDVYARLAAEKALEELVVNNGDSGSAFSKVLPKLDPEQSNAWTFNPDASDLQEPKEEIDPQRNRARFLLDGAHDAGFLGAVVVTPDSAMLTPDEVVVLDVELEGAEECDLIYRWTNSATVGELANTGGGVDSFDTTSPSVMYQADDGVVGSDTVTVEVLVDLGEGNGERSLGSAQAVLDVSNQCVACSVGGVLSPVDGPHVDCPNATELCCTDGINNDDDEGTDCMDIDCKDNPACIVEGNFSIRTLTYTSGGGEERYIAVADAFVDLIPGGARYCVQVDTNGIPLPPPFTQDPYPEGPPFEYEKLITEPCALSLNAEDEHNCEGWIGDQRSIAQGVTFGGPVAAMQNGIDALGPLTGWTFEGRLKTRDESFCGVLR